MIYEKIPENIKTIMEKMTLFERRYAEARVKGLSQAKSAKAAGSRSESNANLAKIGYCTEVRPHVKEYIQFLSEQRSKASALDSTEIVEKARRVYDEAMLNGKFSDANKAVEILGQLTGVLGNKKNGSGYNIKGNSGGPTTDSAEGPSVENLEAFKEDTDAEEITKRMKGFFSEISKIDFDSKD